MRSNYKLSLVALVGVALGMIGATAIHARQGKPPSPAYVISEVDAMDLNGIQKYGGEGSRDAGEVQRPLSLSRCRRQTPGSRW
jgi:hypothetical protein